MEAICIKSDISNFKIRKRKVWTVCSISYTEEEKGIELERYVNEKRIHLKLTIEQFNKYFKLI